MTVVSAPMVADGDGDGSPEVVAMFSGSQIHVWHGDWDRPNTRGEPVASGSYFYQLQTDDRSILRRLAVLR